MFTKPYLHLTIIAVRFSLLTLLLVGPFIVFGQQDDTDSTIAGSYEGEVNYMKNWLSARMKWIDANLQTLQN